MAIGRVCVQWGQLESHIDYALKKLCDFELMDSRALILTAHMSWPLKMDVLESIVNELRGDFPHLTHYEKLKPFLKKAAEGRNKIVHAKWAYENGQAFILRATARGKLKTRHEPVNASDIETIATDIGCAAINVYKTIFNRMDD